MTEWVPRLQRRLWIAHNIDILLIFGLEYSSLHQTALKQRFLFRYLEKIELLRLCQNGSPDNSGTCGLLTASIS